jgi:hypothetical protein
MSAALEIEPTDLSLARAVHMEFSRKPGAEHIASEFALAHLSALVRIVKPYRVLEFGAGIGTISRLLLQHTDRIRRLVATESNQFCLDQLAKNIKGVDADRFHLISDPKPDYIRHAPYDLVVIDGLLDADQFAGLGTGTLCFIEGSRNSTRRAIVIALKARGLKCHFVNYNQGIQYCRLDRFDSAGRRRVIPKFRLRKELKGCLIGMLSAEQSNDA